MRIFFYSHSIFKLGEQERCLYTFISTVSSGRDVGPWTDPDIVRGNPGLFLEAPRAKSSRQGAACLLYWMILRSELRT